MNLKIEHGQNVYAKKVNQKQNQSVKRLETIL